MRYRGVSEAPHLSTRQGAIQLAPSQGSQSRRLAGNQEYYTLRPLWSHKPI